MTIFDFRKLKQNADAIIFGDPAVLLTARDVAPDMKLHWSTETLGNELVFM